MSGNRGQDATDEALFSTAFRKYLPAVTGYAMRRSSPEDAADVVAETFLVAWRRLADIPPEPDTKPWLLGVVRTITGSSPELITEIPHP